MVVLDKEDLDAFIFLEIFISGRPPPPTLCMELKLKSHLMVVDISTLI